MISFLAPQTTAALENLLSVDCCDKLSVSVHIVFGLQASQIPLWCHNFLFHSNAAASIYQHLKMEKFLVEFDNYLEDMELLHRDVYEKGTEFTTNYGGDISHERKESSNNMMNLNNDTGDSKLSFATGVYEREVEVTTDDGGNVIHERKESSNSLINLSKDMGESKPSDTPDVYKREAELTTCDAGNVSNEQSLFSSGDENQDYDVSDNKYLRPGDIIEYRPQSVNHCDLRDNLVLATVTEIIMDEDEVEVKLDDFTTLYGLHGLRRVAKMCNDGKIMMDKSRWHFVNEFNLGCTSLFPSFVPPRKKLFMQNTVNNSLFQFRKSATEFCESYGIPNDIITVRDTVTDQNGDNKNGTPIIKSSTRRSKRTKK